MNRSSRAHFDPSLVDRKLTISFDDVVSTFDADPSHRISGLLSGDVYDAPAFEGDRVNGGIKYGEFITSHDPYYLYTDEPSLLESFAPQVAGIVGSGATVDDLGPGTRPAIERKTKTILKSIQPSAVYRPIDVAPEFVKNAEDIVRESFPDLAVSGEVKDFQKEALSPAVSDKGLILYLGSTISNAPSMQGWSFMGNPFYKDYLDLLRENASENSYLLITHDMNQDKHSLLESYNHQALADMIKSVTHKMERDLLATGIDHDAFTYLCQWNAPANCIEHCIVSDKDQEFTIFDPYSDRSAQIQIKAHEPYDVVNSYKPTIGQMQQKLLDSGWQPLAHEIDDNERLATHLCIST